MLGILLLILKIIGWILLGLVCLFLVLLLLILFVPAPYRFQAEFGDGFTYRLKVFGIQVFPKKEKPGRRKRRRRKRKARAERGTAKEGTSIDAASDAGGGGQEKTGGGSDEPGAKEPWGEPGTQDASEQALEQASLQEPSGTEKPSDMERKKPADEPGYTGGGNAEEPEKDSAKRGGFRRAKTKKRDEKKPPKKKTKKKKFKNKKFGKNKSGKKKSEKKKRETKGMDMDALRQKWELLRTELTDEGNRRAVNHGFSEIAYVLRHCGPRRVKADIAYSLADPANTGYVTAVLCMCPFVYGKGCEIIPDFESEKMYARGRVDVRGHVRLVHFGLSGLRLLIDRDIRAIIRKVRR